MRFGILILSIVKPTEFKAGMNFFILTVVATKLAIFSSIYGGKPYKKVDEIFQIKRWIARLTKSIKDGILENYFGRPINVEGYSENKLLALWLQSSAVDAVLLGFNNLFSENPFLKPHWVIHDACIFSGSGEIPKYLYINENIKLPVSVSEIM